MNSSLYGLSQASRVFYQTVRNCLVNKLDFKVCKSDACILMKEEVIIGIYVDDILIIVENKQVEIFVEDFMKEFKSRKYEYVNDFIGCELVWSNNYSKVILHQSGMIKKLRKKVNHYLDKYKIRNRTIPLP